MVQPDKDPSPEESRASHASQDQGDSGLEGVIEELRQVLSNFNRPVEPVKEIPANENGFKYVLPDQKISDVPAAPDAAPDMQTAPPSDSDFWSGNVLGWSSPPEPPVLETPEPPVMEAPVPPPPPPPEPEPPMLSNPLLDTAAIKEAAQNLIPPMPESPFIEEEKIAEPLPVESPAPPAPILTPPSVDALPIPKSIDDPKPEDAPLELNGEAKKPDGLVQMACIYPKGFEKQGQQFVTMLRTACEKAKTPITMQAVFIQPWSSGMIDVGAWAKSAHLAGADVMFVLTPKKDQDNFKTVSHDTLAMGINTRTVLLEHVGLRTLYADILVKLRRK